MLKIVYPLDEASRTKISLTRGRFTLLSLLTLTSCTPATIYSAMDLMAHTVVMISVYKCVINKHSNPNRYDNIVCLFSCTMIQCTCMVFNYPCRHLTFTFRLVLFEFYTMHGLIIINYDICPKQYYCYCSFVINKLVVVITMFTQISAIIIIITRKITRRVHTPCCSIIVSIYLSILLSCV